MSSPIPRATEGDGRAPNTGRDPSHPPGRRDAGRRGPAALVVALTVAISLLGPCLGGRSLPVIPFLAAVFVCAWYGGPRPGLLTAALLALGLDDPSPVPPTPGPPPVQASRAAVLLIGGGLICALVRLWHGAGRRTGQEVGEVGRRRGGRPAREMPAERDGLFRRLAENFRNVFWMTSPGGDEILYISPAYEEIWGRTCRSLHERPGSWLEPILPEDRGRVGATYARELRSGEPWQEEYRIARPDGSLRWIRDRGFPVRDDRGEVRCVVGIAEDITDRKLAEEQLRERARLAELDAEIGLALVRGETLPEVLGRCAECLVRHLDAAFARIWTLEPAGDVLVLRASAGMYTHLDGPHGRVPVGRLKIGLIARERRPHLTNAVLGDPRVGDQEWARREGMVAFAGYPLLVDDHLVGVLALFARHPLSENALQAMGSVANGIALAIERDRARERLAHQATHDALTGLPNRVLLQRHLGRGVEAARAGSGPFALLMIDLDRFKEINDTFGHHVGDEVLRQMNPRLRAALGESDLLARLGGDEFAALLPGAGEADAVAAARRMLEAIGRPIAVDGHALDVGASIGIALHPTHGDDAVALMQRADIAMYAAKRSRGGLAVYAPNRADEGPRRPGLAAELRRGIEGGQLLLHYQPKLELRAMRVAGAEALVRWLHPREGMLAPDRFIPLAEHTGLIRPLGLWTLHTALLECRAWRRTGMDLGVAVNLSPGSLQDPRLIGAVLGLLEVSEARPSWLTVEITEGAIMADPAGTRETLDHLHEMGVRIAVDDFGTGYSSLAYLRALPVDEVKIDRCFVGEVAHDAKDASIVRSVIDLGHELGLRVVAEGVEDRAGLEALASWGCDLAQGYHISRPLPPSEFLAGARRSGAGPASAPGAGGQAPILPLQATR